MEKDYYFKSIEFLLETKKLSTNQIKDLNHQFLKEIPMHLYKYRKSGDAGMIDFYVGERKIYTASFNKLNDNFEGITPATKQRILNSDAESMCVYYKEPILNILKERFPTMNTDTSNQIFDILIGEHFDKESIYKRTLPMVKGNERKQLRTIISALSYLFDGLEKEMNNNSDFAKGMDMLMNINNLMGAYCMCDSCVNESLWALYADNYSGYCIEYDLSNPCKSKGSIRFITSLYPVEYVDKKDDDWFKPLFESIIKTINIDGKANQFNSGLIFHHWTIKVLCSKKKTWSNEKEWRTIGDANKKYIGPLISSIIVGHNISKNDFSKIQKYANKHYYPIKITSIDYDKQELVIRDISQSDIDSIKSRE